MWHGDADNTLIYSKTTNFPFSVLHSLRAAGGGRRGKRKRGEAFSSAEYEKPLFMHITCSCYNRLQEMLAHVTESGESGGNWVGIAIEGKSLADSFPSQAAFDWNEGDEYLLSFGAHNCHLL